MPKEHVLFWSAIHELKIDVPVMRYEIAGNTVTLYLYGGQVVTWSPSDSASEVKAEIKKVAASKKVAAKKS